MITSANKLCVVVAHPDDETLGAGGTISRIAGRGGLVRVIVVTDGCLSRGGNTYKDVEDRKRMLHEAMRELSPDGRIKIETLNFQDQTLDTVMVRELSGAIHTRIRELGEVDVITHFEGDLNADHRAVCEAVKLACRPTPSSQFKSLSMMEVPSSTEWFGQVCNRFQPSLYVGLEKVHVDGKKKAMSHYFTELGEEGHPRWLGFIGWREALHGSEIGLPYAERFQLVYGRQ